MTEVGIRELKNRLSMYLDRVRRGEIIVVTDRGRPVARIIAAAIPEDIARLIAEGKVTWSGRSVTPASRAIRLTPGPPLSQYISEDRL
jgi:prevent-host-death family protein